MEAGSTATLQMRAKGYLKPGMRRREPQSGRVLMQCHTRCLALRPLSWGAEKEGSASPEHHHLLCPKWGAWGWYLLLIQGQVQECPAAQCLCVPRLSPQHGGEVKHGCLLLTQEAVTAGSGEQGLSGPIS